MEQASSNSHPFLERLEVNEERDELRSSSVMSVQSVIDFKDTTDYIQRLFNMPSKASLPFPAFKVWIRKLRKNFLHDLVAGITCSAVMIAQSLIYANFAGLDPFFTLSTGALPLIIYSLFGTSRHLSVGPISTICLMLMDIIKVFPQESQSIAVHSLALFLGLFFLSLEIFKLTFSENLLSYNVTNALMSAAAVRLIVENIPFLMKVPDPHGNTFEQIYGLLTSIPKINIINFIFGAGTIVCLIIAQYLKEKTRSKSVLYNLVSIFITIVATILCATTNFATDHGLILIGTFPTGIKLTFPDLDFITSQFKNIFQGALIIFLVAYAETLALVKQFAMLEKYDIDLSQESLALGLSNITSAFTSGIPCLGAVSRTPLNHVAGAKSQMAAFICGSIVLILLFVGGPLFKYMPLAPLAGTVIYSATRVVKFTKWGVQFKHFKLDFIMSLVTFFGILYFGLASGATYAIAFSVIIILKKAYISASRTSSSTVSESGKLLMNMAEFDNPKESLNIKKIKEKDICFCNYLQCGKKHHICIVDAEEQLFYFNSGVFKNKFFSLWKRYGYNQDSAKSEKNLSLIVINFSKLNYLDFTGVRTLDEIHHLFQKIHIPIKMSNLHHNFQEKLKDYGIDQAFISDCFDDLHQVISRFIENCD